MLGTRSLGGIVWRLCFLAKGSPTRRPLGKYALHYVPCKPMVNPTNQLLHSTYM
ncbi:hypothetical protein PanWU01x14_059870 [Parasponia andersonii]|uniref:Uncharacterized protein n=1 Tax=Parasponia andersonii TaxID=3476 RepID=A0A2P5DIN8_PARAD|nr:hypothetical protein PanWU01x14_059870 [Parasponia andersonii]